MSLTYIGPNEKIVIQALKDGEVKGLKYEHRPRNPDGGVSLWPHCVTNGVDGTGWFENNFLLFWGKNNSADVITKLAIAGFRYVYSD